MKILSIGNSFSEDAHRWLHSLAKLHGVDIQTANLYIGGCSLETHWKNFCENNAFYDYQINGNEANEKVSINEALCRDNWDIVTLQQVSDLSGIPESYEPYISSLYDKVKSALPDAEIRLHRTWAYEIDSEHPGFTNYNKSQKEMYQKIKSATKEIADKLNIKIIPTGDVIQELRENYVEFDYPNGGVSLCRDGYHLTYDIGRFAAAATWFVSLTEQKINITDFENFDKILIKETSEVANALI
ncbi:MAG: DUF4886 domain-containing protein [Clostridia bacterium]|nr:DUF4886 domain-containing protein [Clostridia bacterium]